MTRNFIIIAYFFLFFGTLSGAAVDTDLFSGSITLPGTEINQFDYPTVIRQRLVNVHFDIFSREYEIPKFLSLNLFDDVHLKAILNQVERSPSGGFAWIGFLDGVEESQVTIVVEGEKISGTVIMPGFYYQVRHAEDDLHLIREIDSSVFPQADSKPLSAKALLSQEMEVINLVNQERLIVGLHIYSPDDRLTDAARGHSEDMALNNYFSHTSLDGRTFSQRITDAGYFWNQCGENIAAVYSTPQAVVNGWMNSLGHKANILSSSFCDIGVGYASEEGSSYYHYWTQDFGRAQGVTECLPLPLQGDLDVDGVVDGSDLAILALNPALLDLSIFVQNYGRSD
ncbi:MAG: CAP domain-containing protein [Desulfosarcina sp.]|nr:CAP domain-containing protein [Desulfobacterales bacterium]